MTLWLMIDLLQGSGLPFVSSVCIFIVPQTGSCHLCLWGSSTDTDFCNVPHARTGDLTNSCGDQSYCLPHYWLCPLSLSVSQELEAMKLTGWFRLPLLHILCQISHVWPSMAIPMLCSKLRTCRVSPQTTILSKVQNKQICHNSQENKDWKFSAWIEHYVAKFHCSPSRK